MKSHQSLIWSGTEIIGRKVNKYLNTKARKGKGSCWTMQSNYYKETLTLALNFILVFLIGLNDVIPRKN